MRLLDTWVGVDEAWCRDVLSDGWGGLIQGVWSGGYAPPLYPAMRDNCEDSLRAMRLAGGLTAAYTNAAPWRDPQVWFNETVKHIGAELEGLSFIVIDHELQDAPLYTTDENMYKFIALLRALGKPLIGYSADWFLGFMVANGFTENFGLDGYWHAPHDGVPDLAVNPPTWRMGDPACGKQYRGDTNIRGKAVDLNEFDDEWIAALTPPPEEDDMKLMILRVPTEGVWLFDGVAKRGLSAAAWAALQADFPDHYTVVNKTRAEVDAIPNHDD